MKKIAMSFATIAAVCAMLVGVTSAYFSDSMTVSDNTFSTGTVAIGDTWQMPVSFYGLYPGAVQDSGVFAVRYDGTVKGDLYYGLKHTPGYDNLESVLDIQVERVTSVGDHVSWVYSDWTSVVTPFTEWKQVATGLNTGEWAYYKLYVRMDVDAGNDYQGKTAVNDIVLYAVQEGGPEPDDFPYAYETIH